MIAASVAAANATLMAAPTGANLLATKSDATGCALCISRSDANIVFVLGGATVDKDNYYATVPSWTTTSISAVVGKTDSLLGDACCAAAGTEETAAGSATFCAKGFTVFDGTHAHSQLKLVDKDFYQSALAQCPHNTTNCVAAVVDSKAATITPADLRYIKLEALGSIATLTIKVLKTGSNTGEVGATPSLK